MGWLSRFTAKRLMKHHGVEPEKYEKFSRYIDENDTARYDPDQVMATVMEAQEQAGGDPEELARILQEKFSGATVIQDGRTVEFGAGPAGLTPPSPGSFDQPTLLSQLEALRDQGVLTDEQFEAQRKQLES